MQIFFRTKQLAKICNTDNVAKRKIGEASADKLKTRLSQIKAADNLSILTLFNMPGRCHKLKADRKNQYAMDLKHPLRLIFEPSDGDKGWNEKNTIIEKKVKEITVIEIKDYH
jgi:proteic killer suppression protein